MSRILLSLIMSLAVLVANAQRICGFADYRQQIIHNTPGLADKITSIEAFTRRLQATRPQPSSNSVTASSVITIPVVVHVIYNSSIQNLSDAQVQSQIDVLNRDYRRQNADTANTPFYFQPFAADCGFHFVLAKVDPHGYATRGIVRKHTDVQQFNINDAIKFSSSNGDDAWDADSYFNIWVGDLTGGVLGYASVVGGPKANDGVVISYKAFGTMGTAAAPFNEGRTGTHETGHWLNLIHTWGDADCGDDKVDDTPPQQAAEYGCPSGIVISCTDGPNGEMYTNYMDFTNDACMNIFTLGQRERMRALFEPEGVRYPMLSSGALAATALDDTAGISGEPEAVALVSVYPNPAADLVTVSMTDQNAIGATIELYNQVGQRVISQKISQLTFQINIGTLNRGIYYLKINDGKSKNVTKLVKF
ncbi:MAG TPA: M43 family zinc metalloprotease [Puia sp.]|nr:M43 family zinc metalloprotease [Puia sp.]